jgi:hypothetical protein
MALRNLRAFAAAGDGRQHGGFGRAGADAVGGDALAGGFAGNGFGEGNEAALGAGVDGFHRGADAAGVRGDIDEASPTGLEHVGQDGAGHAHGPGQVDLQHLVHEGFVGFDEGA